MKHGQLKSWICKKEHPAPAVGNLPPCFHYLFSVLIKPATLFSFCFLLAKFCTEIEKKKEMENENENGNGNRKTRIFFINSLHHSIFKAMNQLE